MYVMSNTETVEKATAEHESNVSTIPMAAMRRYNTSLVSGIWAAKTGVRTQRRAKQDDACRANDEVAGPDDPHTPPYHCVSKHHLHIARLVKV